MRNDWTNLISKNLTGTTKKMKNFDHSLKWTDVDSKEQQHLLNNQFGDWTKKDFNSFIAASAKFGRNNIEKISKDIGKTIDVIKHYHKRFWKDFKIENITSYITKIEKGEDEIKKQNMANNVFKWLCREEHPELGIKLEIQGNSPSQNEEDKYLMILSLKNKFN